MNYLAIDTSGAHLTIIIKKGGVYTEYFNESCGLLHSVELLKKTEELLNDARANIEDFDFFACVTGAGSFTGIRIGVSTIKAFAFANNKPCLAVTSFATMAYDKKGKVATIIDAKHNGFYAAFYKDAKPVTEPEYIMKDALLEKQGDFKLVSAFKIDGLETEIANVKEGLKKAVENSFDKISYDLDALVPLYIKKSQAEEER